MELSLFLAKLIGIYFLIIAAVFLLKKQEMETVIGEILASKGLLVYSGVLSLLLGLMIVIAHPIFTADFRGLITLLGYIFIIRGLARLLFANQLKKKAHNIFKRRYWLIVIILIALGLYLTYSGFVNCPS